MSHPTIVRVYDAGEDCETDADGTTHPVPYIVMELVSGRLLKDIIDDGPVPIPDALRYTDGILEALEYSHRAGVVHRDIKPGNVMVTGDGQVKVMDFGIARAVSDSSSTVAETTAIIGTAAYFSPSRRRASPSTPAPTCTRPVSCCTRCSPAPPFRGDTPVAVAYQHVSETPLALRDRRDGPTLARCRRAPRSREGSVPALPGRRWRSARRWMPRPKAACPARSRSAR
jgi:serine/threonine-protein kinase